MYIEEIISKIENTDQFAAKMAQGRFDALIKPVGSLAKLETMTTKYAAILGKYNKEDITYPKKGIFVWAAPEKANYIEMLFQEKTPLNVLAESIEAKVYPLLIMAETEEEAYEEGMALVQEYVLSDQLDFIGMGCLGSKDDILVKAMTGGILQAAAMKKGIMLDGYSTCKAAAEAIKMAPAVKDYCFAGHVSLEEGAEEALKDLGLEAALRLNIPEGAGEGAAIAFTVLQAGIKAYKEMETFEEAGVHIEVKEFSRKEEMKDSHWNQL